MQPDDMFVIQTDYGFLEVKYGVHWVHPSDGTLFRSPEEAEPYAGAGDKIVRLKFTLENVYD